MTSAPPHTDADPIEAALAFLDDLRAVLDKMRDAPQLTAADLPDISAALRAAVYVWRLEEERCVACYGAVGEPCARHAAQADRRSRCMDILHRLGGKAA